MPNPDWRLTITKAITLVDGSGDVWVVEGNGLPPTIVEFGPPVVVPPPPPPPPPNTPDLRPQPGEDTSPFEYPQGGPTHQADHAARQFNLGKGVPDNHWNTNEQGSGNPSSQSLRWAGRCAPGATTPYGKLVEGFDLWVPKVREQDGITGEWVEVAAPHLIRRALLTGKISL